MSAVVQPVLPDIAWPDPIVTAELLIKSELDSALKISASMEILVDEAFGFAAEDKSDAAIIAKLKYRVHLQAFLASAGAVDLLMQIQKHAPRDADRVAHDWNLRGEMGDWHELIWEWATEHGLSPDEIHDDARKEFLNRENK